MVHLANKSFVRKSRMIKLIAIDVDGTLLNSKHELSHANKKWIQIAAQKGAILVLASGRPISGLLDVFKSLDIDPTNHYLIGFNGAVVVKTSDYSIIYERTIKLDLAQSILKHVKQFPLTAILSRHKDLLVENPDGYHVQGEAKMNHMNLVVVKSLIDILDYNPNKILLSGEPKLIDMYIDDIKQPFTHQVDFVKSAPFYLEIVVKDVNKGISLDSLCQTLNIKSSEVMAIGDNYNDLSMIEYAGHGVAMGQADDFIKERAQFITLSNEEDGVAYAIQNVIEKE